MRLLYFPPFLELLSLLLAGLVYWRMAPKDRPPLHVIGIRWFLGVLFVFSGLAKLIPGFPNTMGPAGLESTLAPHDLAPYARFIAATEVGIGLLMLTRRFATLGALLLVPMLVNILVITTSLKWRGTPYVVSGFLLMDLVLLFYDRTRLLPLISGPTALTSPNSPPDYRSHYGWLLLLTALLLGLSAIRVGPENRPGMLIVAALVAGLALLDWRQSASAS